MSTNNTTTVSGSGFGLGGAVFIVFLTLKLTDYIDWSWWWVTAPLWIPWAIWLVILVVALILTGILNLLESNQSKKNRKARKALDDYRRSLR